MQTIEELHKALTEGVVRVTFTKANGETRQMDATLCEYLLPETTQKSNHPPGETCIVFDLDANDWRSFRYERVNKVDIVEEYNQDWYNNG